MSRQPWRRPEWKALLSSPDAPPGEAARQLMRYAHRRRTVWLWLLSLATASFLAVPPMRNWGDLVWVPPVATLVGVCIQRFGMWSARYAECRLAVDLHSDLAAAQWNELLGEVGDHEQQAPDM